MPKEIYVEFIVLGNTVKATAIDPDTGEEASVVGPATAPQNVMAEAAQFHWEDQDAASVPSP